MSSLTQTIQRVSSEGAAKREARQAIREIVTVGDQIELGPEDIAFEMSEGADSYINKQAFKALGYILKFGGGPLLLVVIILGIYQLVQTLAATASVGYKALTRLATAMVAYQKVGFMGALQALFEPSVQKDAGPNGAASVLMTLLEAEIPLFAVYKIAVREAATTTATAPPATSAPTPPVQNTSLLYQPISSGNMGAYPSVPITQPPQVQQVISQPSQGTGLGSEIAGWANAFNAGLSLVDRVIGMFTDSARDERTRLATHAAKMIQAGMNPEPWLYEQKRLLFGDAGIPAESLGVNDSAR